MLGLVKMMLMVCRGFRENLHIEDLRIEGAHAELTVTRLDSGKFLGMFPKRATDRYKEFWERVDGRWLMLAEKYLGPGEWSTEGDNTAGDAPRGDLAS